MILIFEIALGIVLTVFILSFHPEVIGLGAILVAIVIALLGGGLFLYWVGSSPITLGVLAVVVVGVTLFWLLVIHPKNALVRDLRRRIQFQEWLGYDTTDLEEELSRTLNAGTRARRRELGYTDAQDDV